MIVYPWRVKSPARKCIPWKTLSEARNDLPGPTVQTFTIKRSQVSSQH